MRNWNVFHGCERLSDVECIEFLKHLEDSGRVDTDEGKFLHNQYMRELMYIRGINVNTLEPENGSYEFYNIENLKRKYEGIKDNPTSLYMAWYMRVESYKHWMNVVNETPIPFSIFGATKVIDILRKPILNFSSIEHFVNIIIKNKYYILLAGDNEILNKVYDDVIFKKNDVFHNLSLCKLLTLWCNADAIEKHQCGDDVYIYKANIYNLSFKYKWNGYCCSCGLVSDESKTTGKQWINMDGKPRNKTIEGKL